MIFLRGRLRIDAHVYICITGYTKIIDRLSGSLIAHGIVGNRAAKVTGVYN